MDPALSTVPGCLISIVIHAQAPYEVFRASDLLPQNFFGLRWLFRTAIAALFHNKESQGQSGFRHGGTQYVLAMQSITLRCEGSRCLHFHKE